MYCPAVGGHCLAVDPWFIVEKFPGEARLIELPRLTNDSMPAYVVERLKEILAGLPDPWVTLLGSGWHG
ncbi:MAG: hypothetical protein D9V47_11700 [Clostridia bacterium]|nr:MAG: hypothetical protein D9V47_11700 [Clostridia bacterium]